MDLAAQQLVFEVSLGHRDIRQLEPFVGAESIEEALGAAREFRAWLRQRRIWNISSTAVGGGVAEMLVPLLSYSQSLGVSIRWLVIEGDDRFYRVTKRLHHALHGSRGDGSPLDDAARRIYEATAERNVEALDAVVSPGDIALLHDPQTAGMARSLTKRGLLVIWRSHIGHDAPGSEVHRGWRFLAPYIKAAQAHVFSRRAYVPPFAEPAKAHVIQPSIDAMSPKNQPLEAATVRAIVHHVGAIEDAEPRAEPAFMRTDGSMDRVRSRADIIRHGPPPPPDAPLVLQISRWDPLKDMVGVMQGFAQLVDSGRAGGAHLLLAGPDVRGVRDDPEGPASFGAAAAAWRALDERARTRIGLCMLPTEDIEENAAIVNALQRYATVVTQKSLHEGFGLTVTEAMWKARPVVASGVGGIQDQIVHRRHGLLLSDPQDLPRFADYLHELLQNRDGVAGLYGAAARERVRERFLGVRHLLQYAALMRAIGPA